MVTVLSAGLAVPVPDPLPVAINCTSTKFLLAPTAVKSVLPRLTIIYSFPFSKLPADTGGA